MNYVVRHSRCFETCPHYNTYHMRIFKRSASSVFQTETGRDVDALFANGRIATLERGIGKSGGSDGSLWEKGPFSGEVYPDLPMAMTWGNLLSQNLPRNLMFWKENPLKLETYGSFADRWVVRSVGIQSYLDVRKRLVAAAGLDSNGDPLQAVRGANALLLVSGSHPVRQILQPLRLVGSSVDVLKMATAMRQQGDLPPSISLWATENPLVNDPSSLGAKVEAGAEVIITQPPFLWSKFEDWMTRINKMELNKAVRLLIGTTAITSASNLRFWLRLCKADTSPRRSHSSAAWRRQTLPLSGEALADFYHSFNSDFFHKVGTLGGLGGIHVMPVTNGGRKAVTRLIEEGVMAAVLRGPAS
eukprot:jgi/Botrbrau1/7705/Bobra.0159s0140.2